MSPHDLARDVSRPYEIMSNLFFTADPHFFHDNVIKHCDRPFADVTEMNEALVKKWNAKVGKGDFTWVLGDFDMHGTPDRLAILNRLNGRKGLIMGNHDKCFLGHSQGYKHIQTYRDAGFDYVVPFAQIKVPSNQHGVPARRVMMSHFPYQGDGDGRPDRYSEYRLRDTGRWLICGHIHNEWTQRGRQINVGVDVRGFAPMSLAEIAIIVSEGERDR